MDEGWTRRTVASEPRLSELVEAYEALGFEVRLAPVGPDDPYWREEGCSACLEDASAAGSVRVIHTRPGPGGARPTGDGLLDARASPVGAPAERATGTVCGSTVRVKVRALRPFSQALGAGELELERPTGETLEQLIVSLARTHPAFAKEALDADGHVLVTLNLMLSGRPVGEQDLGHPLRDGDEVLMFMPLSGG